MTNPSKELIDQIEERWKPLRASIDRLPPASLESLTSSGWSAKEMLAHVAFWDEAVGGFVTLAIRNQTLPGGWAFGSGYVSVDGPWPSFVVHNAREAEWARGQPARAVLERLVRAHSAILEVAGTITADEFAQHRSYFDGLGEHYLEHLPELDSMNSG